MISIETLRKILNYDVGTGNFTWRESRSPQAIAGSMAGTIHYSGYRQICISKKLYSAHRLAWFMTYGVWPDDQIDHLNGIRDDNRIENLREVTNKANSRNQAMPRNNTSGVIGVHWYKPRGKWQASIKLDGRKITIGRYESFFDAVSARKSAEIAHGFHENHGREAPVVYPSW